LPVYPIAKIVIFRDVSPSAPVPRQEDVDALSHFGVGAEGGDLQRGRRYGSMKWMGVGFVVGSTMAAGALLQQGDRDAGTLFVLVSAALLAIVIFYTRKH
jgi:hypothetical protein